MTEQTTSGTPRLDTASRLAYERTRLAYERTMMAWVRTATALITFGFSVYKFFQFEAKSLDVGTMLIGPRGFGLALISMGLLSLVLGTIEHGRDLRALRQDYVDMPGSMSRVTSLVMGGIGVLALLAVLFRA
jgi:putative membrane protein